MNTFKTALLLTGLTLLLIFGGAAIAGERGMQFALIIAVVMNGAAYFFSDKIALAMSGAKPVTREQAPRLYAIAERLCGQAGLPLPKLYVIPQPAPNAFATGRNPSNASVAVTAGLMELMNEEEVEGVIAHELGHVRNYDILIASVAATLAGAITMLASMGRFALLFGGYGRGDDRGGGNALGAILMLFLAPIAAVLVQLAISRQREYAADAAAARMVGHPFGLVKALEKLGTYNKRIPMDVAPATASLFIVAPLGAGGTFMSLFSTHPPLEKRIAALRNLVVTR
ncbi:MAG: zinc metalloprotease HtpX [Candidatus Acidiferrales bacterium]